MSDDADDRKLLDRLAGRVGRPVDAVASVRPATRDGWVAWAGLGVDDTASVLTAVATLTGMVKAQERRRARRTGLETRMALAVTEHEAHLFHARAMGHIIGDHVMTVPYGMVTAIKIGKKESPSVVISLVKVTIELADGSKIKLKGDAKHRRVFEQLQARAAAVPVGTIAPAPALRPEPSVARVLASVASRAVKAVGRDSR